MERREVKKFVPRGSSSSKTNEVTTSETACGNADKAEPEMFTKNGVKISSSKAERNKQGAKYFFIALFAVYVCFNCGYSIMTQLNQHFLIESLGALLLSVAVIKAVDMVTGEIPTLLSGAIKIFTITIFFLSIFIGGQHHKGHSVGRLDKLLWSSEIKNVADVANDSEKILSEFGTLRSPGEIWRTVKSFKEGSNVKVRIRGGAVRILHGKVIEPCDYNFPIESTGTIAFEGINNSTSTIEVIY